MLPEDHTEHRDITGSWRMDRNSTQMLLSFILHSRSELPHAVHINSRQ